MFSQLKNRKHIEQNASCWDHAPGWTWGAGGQNCSVGIRDGAPSTARLNYAWPSPGGQMFYIGLYRENINTIFSNTRQGLEG